MKIASRWGKHVGRVLGGTVIVAALVGALPGIAEAKGEYKHWNSSTTPLTVTGYGSTGKAYGQWRVADSTSGTRSWFDANSQLTYNADNHTVYSNFETWDNSGSCWSTEYTTCSQPYYFNAAVDSPHYNGNTWKWLYGSTITDPSANYARGHIQERLDIPWRTDPASGWVFTGGTNY